MTAPSHGEWKPEAGGVQESQHVSPQGTTEREARNLSPTSDVLPLWYQRVTTKGQPPGRGCGHEAQLRQGCPWVTGLAIIRASDLNNSEKSHSVACPSSAYREDRPEEVQSSNLPRQLMAPPDSAV